MAPIFSFVSNISGTLWEAPDFSDHPSNVYEWNHLRNLSDVHQLELLTLGLSFFADSDATGGEQNPPDYSLAVEKRFKDGSPSEILMDISYEGDTTDPETKSEVETESIRVVIQGV